MSLEDVAQEVEAKEWARRNVRPGATERRTYAPDEPGYGPQYCADEACGDDMPPLRRSYGFALCVPCQTRAERAKTRR